MKLFDRVEGPTMHEVAFEALIGAIDDADPNVQRQLAQPYETFANADYIVTRHRFRGFWRLLVRCLDRSETISQSQREVIKNDICGDENEAFDFTGVITLLHADAAIWVAIEPPIRPSPKPFMQVCYEHLAPESLRREDSARLRDAICAVLFG